MTNNKLEEKILESNIKLAVFDSDGVLIPRGTKITQKEESDKYSLTLSTDIVSDRIANKLNELRRKMMVCISSGRSMIYLQEMYNKVLGESTILSAENGSLLLDGGVLVQPMTYNTEYFDKIRKMREEIKNLDILGFEPKQFILTIHAEREVKEVYDIVRKYDPQEELKVMWNGEAFDIQRKTMSKASTVKALIDRFSLKKEEVIAIGDRVNDKEMIDAAGIGVSADKEKLEAEYHLDGELPGEELLDLLLKNHE